MMINGRFRDNCTKRSNVHNKQKRTKNRTLRDTIQKLKIRRPRILNLHIERARSEMRFTPVKSNA
jgi:hypothetical protein